MTGVLLALMLAQKFEQRGFLENQTLIYPQTAPNDSGAIVNQTLLRWDVSDQIAPWLKVSASFDARTDTHEQTGRVWSLDVDDRSNKRPAFSLRRASATLHKGKFTVELGRQFIRWGKADLLNPTDRFAPKDYLSGVVSSDFLGVTAARVTYESGSNTIDIVWQPLFTPSRTPLLDQRWTALPGEAQGIPIIDNGARYPSGSQYGARFNHVGSGYEASVCFFDGYNNLPYFTATGSASGIDVQRYYPKLRLYGADLAVPLSWFTVKTEGAYFTSTTEGADEYALYVIQLERPGEGVVLRRRLRRRNCDPLHRQSSGVRAGPGLCAIFFRPRRLHHRRESQPRARSVGASPRLRREGRILAGLRTALARDRRPDVDSRRGNGFPGPVSPQFLYIPDDSI